MSEMASVGLSATQDLVSTPEHSCLRVSSGFTSPVATAGRWVPHTVCLRA